MELGFENWRWESKFEVYFPRSYVPENDVPVCGGAEQFMTTSVPAENNKYKRVCLLFQFFNCLSIIPEGGDWVYVSAAYPGNATRHEVPHCNPSIIAANGKQGAPSVESTSQCFTTRIQNTIIVLQMIANMPCNEVHFVQA